MVVENNLPSAKRAGRSMKSLTTYPARKKQATEKIVGKKSKKAKKDCRDNYREKHVYGKELGFKFLHRITDTEIFLFLNFLHFLDFIRNAVRYINHNKFWTLDFRTNFVKKNARNAPN